MIYQRNIQLVVLHLSIHSIACIDQIEVTLPLLVKEYQVFQPPNHQGEAPKFQRVEHRTMGRRCSVPLLYT